MKEYKVLFYQDSKNGNEPVLDYLNKLDIKNRAKVMKYIDFLFQNDGYLDEPYSKHIQDKIRELRVDFSNNRHRIFYFTFIKKTIILLHAFLKRTDKTPKKELKKALDNYKDVINNKEIYE